MLPSTRLKLCVSRFAGCASSRQFSLANLQHALSLECFHKGWIEANSCVCGWKHLHKLQSWEWVVLFMLCICSKPSLGWALFILNSGLSWKSVHKNSMRPSKKDGSKNTTASSRFLVLFKVGLCSLLPLAGPVQLTYNLAVDSHPDNSVLNKAPLWAKT